MVQTECSKTRNISCPECGGTDLIKYGETPAGKQKYRCSAANCRHQFVAGSTHLIDDKTRRVVKSLLAEGVSPVKIKKAIPEVSLSWIRQLKRRAKANDK